MITLRTEAEAWLEAQGIRQWTSDYSDYARGVLANAVDSGVAWVVEHKDQVVATASLSPAADMDFWTPEDHPESALYLAKMIVSRSEAGRGLGSSIMNWASLQAQHAGRTWLRIDVRRDNLRLHHYYVEHGFQHVRTVTPVRRRTESGWLAQRPAGSVTGDGPLLIGSSED